MRRLVSLAVLLFFAVPFGLSVTGCKHALATVFCNGGDSGPVVGQVATITLSPTLATFGESLNYGQIGQTLSATAQDCKGNSVSLSSVTYASTDGFISGSTTPIYADINPKTGQVCAGTWNRNTGGGIADFTTCTAPSSPPNNYLAYVTATSNGDVSNAIPIFVHAIPTSIAIGSPSGSCLVGTAATTGSTVAGSNLVTVSSATGIVVGEGLSGLSLPANTSITAVNTVTNTLTISNNATATAPTTNTITGSTALNSPTVAVSSVAGIVVGEGITGTGIPAGTVITAVNAGINPPPAQPTPTLTLSNNATAATTNETLTITLILNVIGNPTSNCCPLTYTAAQPTNPYTGNSCLSQGQTGQLVASVYQNGTTNPADNITCQVGHLSFAAVGATNVVTIDENGVATANQPGSATITASIANSGSGSTAGFFSTCPPGNITLKSNGSTDINVGLNNVAPFSAVVTDTKGNPITGLALEYTSTSPQTIPTSSNSVQPAFPGTATITAVCQPGTCNPAPFSQIGYQGNGTALTSNGVTVNAAGTSSTVLFIGSTSSEYIYPVDFTTNQPATLLKLPYVPNSMVINQAGTEVYLGSTVALMTVSATNNTLSSVNTTVVGQVISVSPDGTTLVVTDSNKDTITLITASSGAVAASYGGIATHASWSPDSQTVYITTTTDLLLVHSAFTNWTAIPLSSTYSDVTVTVPHVGAYFAAGTATDGRSYCPSNTLAAGTGGNPATTTNSFYPLADVQPAASDRIAATTDGNHILAVTAGLSTTPAVPVLNDINVADTTGNDALKVTTACPPAPVTIAPGYFTSIYNAATNSHPLTGVSATAITGVLPSTNSGVAFVTYTGSTANPAGQLPVYFPATGTISAVPLSGAATDPVFGVFSDDDFTFYAGTAGDNKVHEISLTYPTSGNPTATDTGTISPNLPGVNGNIATPNLLVQRPKKATD